MFDMFFFNIGPVNKFNARYPSMPWMFHSAECRGLPEVFFVDHTGFLASCWSLMAYDQRRKF